MPETEKQSAPVSYVVPIKDLNDFDRPYKTINGKPYFAIWSMIVVGAIVFVVGLSHQLSWILGLMLIALAVFVQIKAKSYTQFAFYTLYFLIYEQDNETTCQKIPWDDISEWTIDNVKGTNQILRLKFKTTAQPIHVQLLAGTPVYRAFHKRLPDIETEEIKRRNFREKASHSSFRFPWQKKKKKKENN